MLNFSVLKQAYIGLNAVEEKFFFFVFTMRSWRI